MKNSFSIFKGCLVAGLLSIQLQAQSRGAGSVNYQNVLLDYNARSVGMAGASVGVPDAGIGISANPAAAASIKGMEAFVGYQLVLDGVWASPCGFSREYSGLGVFTISLLGLSSGKIDVVEIGPDDEPYYTGLSAHDEYFTPALSFARSFFDARLSTGITLKGLYHRIDDASEVYSSKAIAVDIGVQYLLLSDRLVVGVVLNNAGGEFAHFANGASYPLPLLLEAGVSYIPRYLSALRIALDINKIKGEYVGFEPGIEIEVYPRVLFARAGYRFSQFDLSEQFNKFSGDNDESYKKSNWSTFSAGIGVRTGIDRAKLQIDFGIQFRESLLPPSPVLSAVVDF